MEYKQMEMWRERHEDRQINIEDERREMEVQSDIQTDIKKEGLTKFLFFLLEDEDENLALKQTDRHRDIQ